MAKTEKSVKHENSFCKSTKLDLTLIFFCIKMEIFQTLPTLIMIMFDSDTTSEITDLESIQGDWWILKGQNCGQDELWNGGYDAYPCQLESFFIGNDGDWVRNTTFCFGQDNQCNSQTINIQPKAFMESPGVVKTTYENPLYMEMEER